ncbi:LysM peptidoglycan-binding domain-containing protein [Fodinibius salsisoli]|uniref:LysM peptidoglycan-binding domain-containing protein n=1 Tax=Fodinibius salsisoli TaxID=2820877 RepID=A0ABT3PM52_9BACT|nr:LysM peptidoglycan-binding domain-containing protein [Fodinibius salsisoli]MCW9706997.1 LysM peptidoglycan-binding domain-containing protein [Fodinibius salsisoli]
MNVKSCLLGLALIISVPLSSVAQQTTTHSIQKGETLFSIAEKYNVEVEQLKKWNNLSANELSVGQSIIVRKEGTVTADESTTGKAQTHTVSSGETLFSISKKYQVSIAELKSWNDLAANNLSVGQTLTIYPSTVVDKPQQSIVTNQETQQNTYYVVKNNDSLFKIARNHGMSVSELKKLNNLSSNTIRVGQQLTVRSVSSTPSISSAETSSAQGKFMTHRVSRGSTTVADLTEKFRMDEEEFRVLNPGIGSSQLRNGQQVTVLAPPSKSFKNPYVKKSSPSSMNSLGTVSVSHYQDADKASPTTNGELYNPDALTAAHANIALGSVIFVKGANTPHGVFVRINDRISGDGLKLSAAAWNALDLSGTTAAATIYQN